MDGFVVRIIQFSHPFCCPCLSLLSCLFSTLASVVNQILTLCYFLPVLLGAGLNTGSKKEVTFFFHGATG